MQDVAHQRALAGAGHAGHHCQPRQRQAHVEILQVVQPGAPDLHVRIRAAALESDRAAREQRMAQRLRHAAAGDGLRLFHQLFHRTGGNHFAAVDTRTGPQVDDVFGAADGVLVVFDHHDGVAFALQSAQRVEQHFVVSRVQADGGFVEDIAYAAQVRAQLRSEADNIGSLCNSC